MIDLFSFHLLQEGALLKHALEDGDVDTMIVQQAMIDVFIALLHHFDISGNSIVMTTKQGLCSIEKVVSALDDDLRQCYWSVMPYLDVTPCQLPLVWESWRLLTNLRNPLTGEVQ